MSRPGLARPVVIKMDADIGEDIVRSKMRTLGISRNRFDELLSQVRGSKKPKRKKKNRCPSTLPLAEGLTPPAGKCVLLRSWTRMVHAARPWTNLSDSCQNTSQPFYQVNPTSNMGGGRALCSAKSRVRPVPKLGPF